MPKNWATALATVPTITGRALFRAPPLSKAETLRKLLTLRFGELTEPTEIRIVGASEAELDRWIERVLTADTVEAVIGV